MSKGRYAVIILLLLPAGLLVIPDLPKALAGKGMEFYDSARAHHRNVMNSVSGSTGEGDLSEQRGQVHESCGKDPLCRAQLFEKQFLMEDAYTAYEAYLSERERRYEGCKAAGMFFLRRAAVDMALNAFEIASQCTDASEATGGAEYSAHFYYLGILNELGLDGAAIDYCLTVLGVEPRNDSIRLWLIELFRQREMLDDILLRFNRLTKLDAKNARHYRLEIAREFLRVGKREAAANYCRELFADNDPIERHEDLLEFYSSIGLVEEAGRELDTLRILDPDSFQKHHSLWLESSRTAFEDALVNMADTLGACRGYQAGLVLLRHQPEWIVPHLRDLAGLTRRIRRYSDAANPLPISFLAQARLLDAIVASPDGRKCEVKEIAEIMEQPEARGAVDSLCEVLANTVQWSGMKDEGLGVVETFLLLEKHSLVDKLTPRLMSSDMATRVSMKLLHTLALERMGRAGDARRVRAESQSILDTLDASGNLTLSYFLCRHGMVADAAALWDRAAERSGGDLEKLKRVYERYLRTEDAPRRGERIVEIAATANAIVSNRERSRWGFYHHYFHEQLPLAYAHAGRCEEAIKILDEQHAPPDTSRLVAGPWYYFERAGLIMKIMDAGVDCRTRACMESVLVCLDRARPIMEKNSALGHGLRVPFALRSATLHDGGPRFVDLVHAKTGKSDRINTPYVKRMDVKNLSESQLQDTIRTYVAEYKALESESGSSRRAQGQIAYHPFPRAASELANRYYTQGDLESGDDVIDQIVSASSLSGGTHNPSLVLALHLSSKWDRWNKVVELAELAELALSETPDDGHFLETLAIAYEEEGRLSDCIQVYEYMQRTGKSREGYLAPAHYRAWGRVHHRTGDKAKAVEVWKRMLNQLGSNYQEVDTNEDLGYGAFLELLLSSGLPDEALHYGEQALLLDPYNAGFHLHRIDILISMGHTEEALKALVEMQRRLPVSHHWRQVKERTLGIYRMTNCRRFLESWADHAQGGWWTNELGDFCLVRGKLEDALRWKRIAVDQAPENRLFKAALAFTLTEAGQYEEAARLHGNLIEEVEYTQSDLLYYLLQLANDRYLLGDLTQAREAWRAAAAVAPPSWESNFILGRVLLNHGEVTEARRHLELALTASPDSLHVLSDLMLACAADHDLERVRSAASLLDSLGHPCWFADLLRRVPEHGREEFIETVERATDSRSEARHERCDQAPPSIDDIRFAKLVNGLSLHEKLFDYLPHLSN